MWIISKLLRWLIIAIVVYVIFRVVAAMNHHPQDPNHRRRTTHQRHECGDGDMVQVVRLKCLLPNTTSGYVCMQYHHSSGEQLYAECQSRTRAHEFRIQPIEPGIHSRPRFYLYHVDSGRRLSVGSDETKSIILVGSHTDDDSMGQLYPALELQWRHNDRYLYDGKSKMYIGVNGNAELILERDPCTRIIIFIA